MQNETSSEPPAGLKTALELGPVVLFILAYNFGQRFIDAYEITGVLSKPIFLATLVLMVATPIAILVSWIIARTLPAMPIVTLVVVTIFGGLTLYLQDDTFIKLKPTIVNCIFGGVLLGGLAMGHTLIKYVLGAAFKLDDLGWRKLTFRWGLFFFFLAIVNEIVWRNFSESFWVGFKLWGMSGLSFLFILTQLPMVMKHTLDDEEEAA